MATDERKGAISSSSFVPPGAGGVRGGHPEDPGDQPDGEITKVPRSPEFVEGIINLRGKVIPDRGSPEAVPSAQGGSRPSRHGIVVVGVGGEDDRPRRRLPSPRSFGSPAETIEPPPPIVAGIDSAYISGVGKLEDRPLILLDLGKVLSAEEKHVLAGVA